VVKRFTGENTIRAEAKFQDAVDIPVVGHGVLLSQHKPNIYDQSRSIWERLRLINFNHYYEESLRNPTYYEDVLAEELPVILRLSVETWLHHQEKKTDYHLIYPEMRHALAAYRKETDYFGQFADACLLLSQRVSPRHCPEGDRVSLGGGYWRKSLSRSQCRYIKKVVETYVINANIAHPFSQGSSIGLRERTTY